MSDEILSGMMEAEFSAKQRGSMLPDSVIAEYRALDFRPRAPYIPPVKTVEISERKPESEKVFSVAVVRILVVAPALAISGAVFTNGAAFVGIIAAAVAPVAAVVVGLCGIGFLFSCLRGDSVGAKKGGSEYHYHYHNHYNQNNNTGNGEQKNG